MNVVRLGEIAESRPCDYGDNPVQGAPKFEVVKVSNVSGEGRFHGEFEKRSFGAEKLPGLLVDEGELLVVKSSGSKANILSGKTAICGPDRAGRIVASNFLLRLRVDESAAIPKYIWYVLNSGMSKAFVKTIVGASTYPNLKWSLYSSHPIPLPSLPRQRRIAEILDKADTLRTKRRAALAQLDELVQSIFLEMFGDPATNPKGWPTKDLGDLIIDGPQNGLYKPASDYGTGTPILRIDAFYDGKVTKRDSLKRVRISGEELTRYGLCSGDIVINRVNSREYLGKSALIPRLEEPTIFESNMMRFRVDEQYVHAGFVVQFLQSRFVKAQILKAAKDAVNQSSINQTDVRRLRIYIPPLELQHEFWERVATKERLMTIYENSLSTLDKFFASLQQRAFRGEL